MDWQRDLLGLLAGFVIATITAPVGVSGAVFLLPVQLTFLGVPSPQITPTNLLYNLLAGPGALLRYARRLDRTLAGQLIVGSTPGVVLGAILRVYVATDPTVFRVIAAAVLIPTGVFILWRREPQPASATHGATVMRPKTVTLMAFLVGILGGIYGVGGGSILGPILIGTGISVAVVAPAALASTFVSSVVGVAAYSILALNVAGTISPDWSLGIACGIGGLVGGYLGAYLQPQVPEQQLRRLLGTLAIGLGVAYLVQAMSR